MKENYDTTVNGWFIVQLTNDDKQILAEVLWGIVEHDKKMRFGQGDYVCTSVIAEKAECYVYTQYSTYKLLGSGTSDISLPMENILLLRQGFSPDMILTQQIKENEL